MPGPERSARAVPADTASAIPAGARPFPGFGTQTPNSALHPSAVKKLPHIQGRGGTAQPLDAPQCLFGALSGHLWSEAGRAGRGEPQPCILLPPASELLVTVQSQVHRNPQG